MRKKLRFFVYFCRGNKKKAETETEMTLGIIKLRLIQHVKKC